jgi:hypothetical protein
MRRILDCSSTRALALLLLLDIALAMAVRAEERTDRWNSLWLTQASGPCLPGLELPGGSGQEYLGWTTLWIGALIVDEGYETKRVSVGTDGWLNPGINEFWPFDAPVTERSRLDTVNEFGAPIYDPAAIADHEFETAFTDTLRDEPYVLPDPIDGVHRPLGIKVTRTTYTMLGGECDNLHWMRIQIQNIGFNYLRQLYVGLLGYEGGVHDSSAIASEDYLLCTIKQFRFAFLADNDGRRYDDSTGNHLVVPNVVGARLLPDSLGQMRTSLNWWISHGNPDYDFGPAWQAYAEGDSLSMGWTATYGTPMGDERKYDLMRNGEWDFDQVMVNDPGYIARIRDGGQAWHLPDLPNAADIANGAPARFLLSAGPVGIPDYQDASGRWILRLNPGEQCDVWIQLVGGYGFHNADHPQPSTHVIDPGLFVYDDLFLRLQSTAQGLCAAWLGSGRDFPRITPAEFTLDPVYPNPFNAAARIRFCLQRASAVRVTVFDVLGREVARIADGTFDGGWHEIAWDASELATGVYLVAGETPRGARIVQKAVLLK